MSAPRFGKIQKATALVPLALLSTAWTASLAGVGGLTSASDTSLPDGSQVPIESLEDPASFTAPGQVGLGLSAADGEKIVAAASTNGIPTAALAAYQRAEQVINDADKSCHIDWALIAAIGRVESDHGRYGGNTLDTKGVSHPGIYGPALNGTNETQAISDTDGGLYDNDKVWDRAVGAMQFIPQTWSRVGVDADGDGKRNPQDIDDAALASAVYLCSGSDDLGAEAGRRASVFRYNHSNEYVDLVLRIRDAYLEGNYTAVPNYITSAYTFSPPTSYTPYGGGTGSTKPSGTGKRNEGSQNCTGTCGVYNPGPGEDGGTGGPGTPSPTPTPTPTPSTPPLLGGGGGGGTTDPTEPIKTIIEGTTKVVEDTTKAVTLTVAKTLCTTEATAKDLTTPLVRDYTTFYNECMARNGYPQ